MYDYPLMLLDKPHLKEEIIKCKRNVNAYIFAGNSDLFMLSYIKK